jgi:hypothetical protein
MIMSRNRITRLSVDSLDRIGREQKQLGRDTIRKTDNAKPLADIERHL